ncbi:MAG: DUF1150 family protein [Acetobacter sp.]|nr:DUF1150 family protein [Acetobacter sp.]MBO7349969.1 DUF1150 family protein [Acetobacter sp.]
MIKNLRKENRVLFDLSKCEKFSDIRQLTDKQFRLLGLKSVAYIRPILTDEGESGYAICAADGSLLAVVEEVQEALAAILQNDMIPVSVQ